MLFRSGVTRESNDAIGKFKRNLIRKHCREFRPMEVLYELNLFYPFSLLLNWGIYRHHVLYKYANLIKLYYKIWGRLYHVEYIDGTKIESKANKYTFVWRKTVERNRERLMVFFPAPVGLVLIFPV